MSALPAATSLPRRTARRDGRPGIDRRMVATIFVVGLAVAGWRLFLAPGPATAVGMAVVEQEWGIRVTMIGVTADGGLLDMRFQVTDADLAAAFLDDAANLPLIVDEDSGAIVRSAALMANKHDLQAGRTYFVLYRNASGAIQRGSSVSLVFGELRLEHLIAQ